MELSTTKAEYMATTEAGKEIIWMKEFIRELGIQQEEFRLHCDNQSVIHLVKKCFLSFEDQTHTTEVPLDPGEDNRERVCSSKDAHERQRVRHVDEGIVRREVEYMPTKGQIDETPHAGVKGRFVRK